MRSHTPAIRLRSFNIGDTLKLVRADTTRPLFFAYEKEGFGYLYQSEKHYLDGKRWDVAASLYHLAEHHEKTL